MKKIFILIGAIIALSSCGATRTVYNSSNDGIYSAQPKAADGTVNNFVLDQGTVCWQKVYDMSDANAVRQWFATNFTVTSEGEARIVAESQKNALPITESGLKRMSVVMLFTHPCVVYFTTEFKENRYRVTVNNIIWYPQVAITTYGVSQGVGAMDLSEIAVKNGAFKNAFATTSSRDLDTMLTYMFKARLNDKLNNDNW